jgi:sugar phosphate isomerase/epimerase
MPRPLLLFSGPFADLPLEAVVSKASQWGYQGFELCCWGDHFEVQRALSEEGYCPNRVDFLARNDLHCPVVAAHKVGQAIGDVIDERHQALVPDYVWGDGKPAKVQQRAAEEMTASFRAAEKLGAVVVSGFTGSSLWNYVTGYPGPRQQVVADAMKQFAKQWNPILDVARDCGIRFACEVHPGQLAYDYYSAEMVLDAIDHREEFGFTLDPSHFLWQGVDPVEFMRRFADRIYHVHIKDGLLALNGRTGVLSGLWPSGDPRRGFQFRSPGRGQVEWEAFLRGLNEIAYDGPLSVDWHDAGFDRDYGAADALQFLQRMQFDPPPPRPTTYRG